MINEFNKSIISFLTLQIKIIFNQRIIIFAAKEIIKKGLKAPKIIH